MGPNIAILPDLALATIVEAVVGTDALRDDAIDRLTVGAILPNV